MKFSKIISLFIILNFAMIQIAQANIFSQGFEYLRNRFAQLDEQSQETLKAAGAFSLFAGFIGAALYFSKQRTSESIELDPKIQARVHQLEVAHQTQPATCGYHAFDNGKIALELHKNGHPILDSEEFKKTKHFDTESSKSEIDKNYLSIIKEFREKEALKTYLQTELKKYLTTDDAASPTDRVLVGKYQMALDNIAKGIADSQIERNEKEFDVVKKNIDGILFIQNSDEDLKKPEHLKKFLPDLAKLNIEVNQQLIDKLVKEKHDTESQWIDGDEIRHIETKVIGSTNNSSFIVLDDVDQIDFYDPIIHAWRTKPNGALAIPVGTMKQKYKSRGHWVLLFAEKTGNSPSYYVADSLGNNLTRDPLIQRVIRKLEPMPFDTLNNLGPRPFLSSEIVDLKSFVQTKK